MKTELENIYNEFNKTETIATKTLLNCEYCDFELTHIGGSYTCTNCGIVHNYIQEYSTSYNSSYTVRKSIYKRYTYFKTLLNLMAGYTQCKSKKYITLLTELKNMPFNNVFELKRNLKLLKHGRYHKYIYKIYF
jgi:hypothetical protein